MLDRACDWLAVHPLIEAGLISLIPICAFVALIVWIKRGERIVDNAGHGGENGVG